MKKFLITFLLSINLLFLLSNHEVASNNDFIQWKCYENFQSKAKLILTIGYLVSTEEKGTSLGFMTLETNKKIIPVTHKIKGIRDSFYWADDDGGYYSLIMSSSSGKSFFYDYNLLKIIQDPKMPPEETLNCKNKKTIKLDKATLKTIFKKTGLLNKRTLNNISVSDIDKIRKHISSCWKPLSSASNFADVVSIKISINKDMDVTSVNLVDRTKYTNDSMYRAVADSARRAILDCSPLPIKKEYFDHFETFIMDFDASFLR